MGRIRYCHISHTFDLFLPTPSCISPLALHPSHSAPSQPNPTHPTPGMASILMSAVGLGVHFTSAPLPQQQQQHPQQQPAPFSLPPPLLPPASRPSKAHSSNSSSSVRRAKRQHRRGSYHANIHSSASFLCHLLGLVTATGPNCTRRMKNISSCVSSHSSIFMCCSSGVLARFHLYVRKKHCFNCILCR